MGFYTSFFQSFITTLFNIRLGMWLPNPKFTTTRQVGAQLEQAVYEDKIADTDEMERSQRGQNDADQPLTPPTKQTELTSPWDKFWATCWPRYLLRELTAMTTAELPRINLSDGGHTGDNLGLYPLLQRRCKLIILCDGENDPEYCFGSLIHALRMINVDENVQVEFSIDDIRKRGVEKLKHARSHFMVGRISYPAAPGTCVKDGYPEQLAGDYQASTGWIVYLKSSFTGKDEPAAVKSYKAFNDDFPHQSTADQFFDDAQFEAYRQLGGHIAQDFIKSVKKSRPSGEMPLDANDIVAWAEKMWTNPDGVDLADLKASSAASSQGND
ncbi:MAG: hypothetical protein AAF497_06700 [Planctomycetota bacterium]